MGDVGIPSSHTLVVKCPNGTPKPERAVWARHASDAIAAGTLTAQTARSFVQLVCEPRVIYNRILQDLDAQGWTYWKDTETGREPKKNPLIIDLKNWQQRVADGHARFGLSPFGKPLVAAEKPEDPFAEFEAHA